MDEYEYRKVYAKGHYRHDQEILLGPRTRGDGNAGYFVITPFERDNGTTILVKRGWISPDKKDPRARPESFEQGEVEVVGLIRVNEEVNIKKVEKIKCCVVTIFFYLEKCFYT